MALFVRRNFAYTRGIPYPMVITEDTRFIGCNFTQAAPHTEIFDVAEGVTVVFEECNLLNVSVPDGAEVYGGNLAHVLRVPVEDPELDENGYPLRDFVNLLCDDERCVSAAAVIRGKIKDRSVPKDSRGRIKHHEMKDEIRAARPVTPALTQAHIDENVAALARWTRDEAEAQGWFAAAWGKIKNALGMG